ncbi:biopolymer transporter ExbD [soil metagenome]
MAFRRGRVEAEPEINLIPFIDVLLVILIFLMVTTTYSRFSELQITLPSADANKAQDRPKPIQVAVTSDGKYAINNQMLGAKGAQAIADGLRRAAGNDPNPVIIINADANATHQSVISVLEAARMAGYAQLTFATQATGGAR